MIPGSANPLLLTSAAAAGGYQIERSLRFNSSDSAYLSRTPSVAGNQKTWTLSFWMKRTALGNWGIFEGYNGSTTFTAIRFVNEQPELLTVISGAYTGIAMRIGIAAQLRDFSAWYHFVIAFDTTQPNFTDAVKFYINGVQQSTSLLNGAYTQNSDHYINRTIVHSWGKYNNGTWLAAYLADAHFIDGQALDPTDFGEFDANGVWQPIEYAGTYGTNGFHLPFSDNSTAAALGTDASGAGNNWTVNNISVAAGSGNDSLVDTPTSYGTDTGAGGEVRGNYCTLNPLWNNGHILSNGNLDYAPPSPEAWTSVLSTFGMPSGKWYWEQTYISGSANCMAGFGNASSTLISYPTSPNSTGYDFVDGNIYGAGAGVSAGATLSAGDIMGISVDVDAGEAKFYKNGVLQTTLSHGITGTLFPLVSSYDGVGCVNFGQRPFAYAAPSGFKSLCTTNLDAPLVAKPNEVMDVKLYTGNGSTQTISGLGFSPDLVWIKGRSLAYHHRLVDSVRGAQKLLFSSLTDAETTSTTNDRFTSFDSSGFTLGSADDTLQDGINQNLGTYVAWAWDAGSSTVTNTQGSITSQVRANASAGFSIVTWTANTTTATVGHGLNVAPSLVIMKDRDSAIEWMVYNEVIGQGKYLALNSTSSVTTASTLFNPAPTSAVFSPGSAIKSSNGYGKLVAYCFAPVAGYSSMGSYVGNGSADGPFVYTGFRPRFILIKRSDGSGNWIMVDSIRLGYNASNNVLQANLANAEGTYNYCNILSNGFKIQGTDASGNASGSTYVYYAVAENPFQYARAR